MDADALGLGAMANASFFQHYPLENYYPQNKRPTFDNLIRCGFVNSDGKVTPNRYITFYIGDYDSAAWLYSQGTQIWNEPNRGKMPLRFATGRLKPA